MYDRSVSEEIKYEQQKGSSVEELPFLFYKKLQQHSYTNLQSCCFDLFIEFRLL